MKVAIIGSRDLPERELEHVRRYVASLPHDTTIISGGARGVDSTAADAAAKRGLSVREYLPDYNQHGRQAPLVRNQAIVDDADLVVAFWDGKSQGTLHATGYAKQRGVPVQFRGGL